MIANPSYKSTGCGCGDGALSTAPCSCGGSECASCQGQGIVRPRFFAGQLLTEDDLQLLTDYVGYKDRLHNRHLFGAGVVCGLEVSCHPCGDGRVIVHPGYALDCCGNDLTLACAQMLDINSMIRDLRRDQLGGYDCGDPCLDPKELAAAQPAQHAQGTQTVDDEQPKPERRYCLYIRYCEQPSDPVMPYSSGEDCGQVSCQPTRTREGVKFDLRCVPRHAAANPLIERLCACIGDVNRVGQIARAFERIQIASRAAGATLMQMGQPTRIGPDGKPIPPGPIPTNLAPAIPPEQLRRLITESLAAFRDLRDWLLERFNNAPFLTDCTLRDKVYVIVVPEVKELGPNEIRAYLAATEPLMEVFINFLRDCICRAFNPACAPCDDSAVLLACLTVDECKVVKICNLERTFVLSPAAVRYWLAPLQLAGNVIERLCRDPLEKLLRGPKKTEDFFRYDLDNFDIETLLKEEGLRILADSLCLVNKEILSANVERILPRRSSKSAARKSAQEDTASVAATREVAREEARAATAGAAAASPSKKKVTSAATNTAVKSRKKAAVKNSVKESEKAPEPPPAAPVTNGGNGAKTNGPKGGEK